MLRRLTPGNSEKIYEVEDVLEAFDGLHKAARSAFSRRLLPRGRLAPAQVRSCVFARRIAEDQRREQKERYESQVEGLRLKVDHLQNESSKLQNLFREKSNINELIRQEVSRLSRENSVR